MYWTTHQQLIMELTIQVPLRLVCIHAWCNQLDVLPVQVRLASQRGPGIWRTLCWIYRCHWDRWWHSGLSPDKILQNHMSWREKVKHVLFGIPPLVFPTFHVSRFFYYITAQIIYIQLQGYQIYLCIILKGQSKKPPHQAAAWGYPGGLSHMHDLRSLFLSILKYRYWTQAW